jgi:hypothetical protein
MWLREVNMKMGFIKVRWKAVDWINLALDNDQGQAVTNTVMDIHVT